MSDTVTPTVLDEVSRLVLAPNPSPMTLEGTNTYLLGDPTSGGVVVVDPGPDDPDHLGAVEAALDGADVAAVVITHHHHDHAGAAGWADRWRAPLRAFDPDLVPGATRLGDGQVLAAAGIRIEAVHTPGHASDHLCLRVVETDVVLTGDHVLGRGTTVVNWPDGDMADYMASLERLATAPGSRLYPGHGPTVEEPAAKVREYLAHRREREAQIREALAAGADSPAAVVAAVYVDVPAVLHPAAERSVRAVLHMLHAAGEVDPAVLGDSADDGPPRGDGPPPGDTDPSGLGAGGPR